MSDRWQRLNELTWYKDLWMIFLWAEGRHKGKFELVNDKTSMGKFPTLAKAKAASKEPEKPPTIIKFHK